MKFKPDSGAILRICLIMVALVSVGQALLIQKSLNSNRVLLDLIDKLRLESRMNEMMVSQYQDEVSICVSMLPKEQRQSFSGQ